MRKQYVISLTPTQRAEASAILARGQSPALTSRHARILLEVDALPGRRVRSDRHVAELCGVSPRTVARVRERFVRAGFAVALQGRSHPGSRPKLSSDQEARLIALTMTDPERQRVMYFIAEGYKLLAERAELRDTPKR